MYVVKERAPLRARPASARHFMRRTSLPGVLGLPTQRARSASLSHSARYGPGVSAPGSQPDAATFRRARADSLTALSDAGSNTHVFANQGSKEVHDNWVKRKAEQGRKERRQSQAELATKKKSELSREELFELSQQVCLCPRAAPALPRLPRTAHGAPQPHARPRKREAKPNRWTAFVLLSFGRVAGHRRSTSGRRTRKRRSTRSARPSESRCERRKRRSRASKSRSCRSTRRRGTSHAPSSTRTCSTAGAALTSSSEAGGGRRLCTPSAQHARPRA